MAARFRRPIEAPGIVEQIKTPSLFNLVIPVLSFSSAAFGE